jgi:hypothetical protein
MIIIRLSPEPVDWVKHHQLYSAVETDVVMESFTQLIGRGSIVSVTADGNSNPKG